MARCEMEHGRVPLHHRVYLDLRTKLDDGTYRPGDRLPPERELARAYGLSLITVRRALDELARERRIERAQGRGTHVLPPLIERDLAATLSFTEEMRARGLQPETRLLEARIEPASDAIAAALNLPSASPVVYLERLRLAAGEPMLLEQVRLPAQLFPGLLECDLERQSLYEVLAEQYGHAVAVVREGLEPVLLKAREAHLLALPSKSPALLVEGVAYTATGLPVEFGRTYVRSDRTRYYVERSVVRSGRWSVDTRPQPVASRR